MPPPWHHHHLPHPTLSFSLCLPGPDTLSSALFSGQLSPVAPVLTLFGLILHLPGIHCRQDSLSHDYGFAYITACLSSPRLYFKLLFLTLYFQPSLTLKHFSSTVLITVWHNIKVIHAPLSEFLLCNYGFVKQGTIYLCIFIDYSISTGWNRIRHIEGTQ